MNKEISHWTKIVRQLIVFLFASISPLTVSAQGGLNGIDEAFAIIAIVVLVFLTLNIITLTLYFLKRSQRYALLLILFGCFLFLIQLMRLYGSGRVDRTTVDYILLLWAVLNILVPVIFRPVKI
jgi:hypothetical protein